ncbi:MAG TPA: transposase [Dehalococcoidia bacterium]|nr:transposase [Dehalococcoidia bacterium]
MTVWLRGQGHAVNRKRAQRLMRLTGIEAIYRPSQDHQTGFRTQGVSLPVQRPAQRPSDQRGEPGLGDRHRLYPDGAGIHVPGSHHGLAQPVRALVEVVQHPGSRLLRACVGGGIEHGHARDIQHRPSVVSSLPRRSPLCC